MDANRFIELLESYLQNRAGEDEQQELFLMIASGKYDAQIQARIDAAFAQEVVEMDAAKANEIREYILSEPGVVSDRPQADGGRPHGVSRSGPRVIRMYWKWIAAACIIALVGVLANVWLKNNKSTPPAVATTHDVPAPSNTRAVITLADGTKVYLDSVNNGTIARQNDVAVVKNSEGGIVYQSPGGANSQQLTADSPVYNTLFNPRGSKVIDMTLSDGSHVWLNSGSSIKYPVAFIGKERVVEITGEAYFEVKHNSKQPFKVHLPNGSVVEDIGTSFNVNAYSDEDAIRTTLIEGSVRLMSPAGGGDLNESSNNKRPGVDRGITLKPGQQAAINPANPSILGIMVQTNVNLEEVMAWKNGRFSYNGVDIQTIMREAARWYDVDVVFNDDVKEKFYADVPRNTNISTLLKMLEITKAVHFKIEGKRITVTK